MRDRSHESGQATVMTALSLVCLLGFTGLATDVGLLFHAKRTLQTAADAAAIAGAGEVPSDTTKGATLVTSFAQTAAGQNGYTDGSNGVTVVVHSPALTGSHTGAGTVEVVVSQSQSTFFMKLFGFSSVPVSARAVAVKGAPSTACLTILAPSGSGALQLQGNYDVSASHCGVIVNSNDPDAIDITGNAKNATLNAGSVGVVGGCDSASPPGDSVCQSHISPNLVQIAPTSDPLYFLPDIPDSPSGCVAPPGNGILTSPGCYIGNFTVNGMSAGTYTFTGNVTLGAFTATGVTFLLPKGANLGIGNGIVNLTAPTTGTYAGVLIYQSRDNPNTLQIQFGSSGATLTGIIYAPDAELYLQDHGGSATATADIVVKTMFDKTSTLTLTSYTQTNPNSSPLTKVVLVE